MEIRTDVGKMKSSVFEVGLEPIAAVSEDVLTAQRRVGKRHTLEIYNGGETLVFFGGPSVTPESGIPIFPNERRIFPVREADAIYLVAKEPTKIAIAEYCI